MTRQMQFGVRPDIATFSPCGTWRYDLTRELGGERPLVVCGLNPSTATADDPDQTISKDVGFARRWQYGRMVKYNAYAYCAREPSDMKAAARAGVDIFGPDNRMHLLRAAALVKLMSGTMVVAWGVNIDPHHQADVAALLSDVELWCFGTNDNGTPKHELYLPYTTELVRWECP